MTGLEDSSKSPLTIIQQIHNAIDTIGNIPELTELNYGFDTDYKQTKRTIDFITYQNMTVLDVIQYCLARAIHQQCAPYFYMQRMLDNKAMLVNFFSENQCLFNKNNYNLEWFFTKVNLEDVESTTGISEQLTSKNKIYDATIIQGYGGLNQLYNIKSKIFNSFDHLTRTWSTDEYSSILIDSLLTQLALIIKNSERKI